MKYALSLARIAGSLGEVPVGAVVVQGDEIVGEGINLREHLQDPTAHAEILALQAAARKIGYWRLEGCTLYVTLEPCPMCAGALVNARVKRLVFGALDLKAGACDSLFDLVRDPRLNHRLEVESGVMALECGQLLTDFFQDLRKRRQKKIKPVIFGQGSSDQK
jgi:tRNA(adenine34) deaminase